VPNVRLRTSRSRASIRHIVPAGRPSTPATRDGGRSGAGDPDAPRRDTLATTRGPPRHEKPMLASQYLDALPIPAVFVVFAIVSLLCYEGGFRLGLWWQNREPGEQEGPTGVLVGSILALLAFLLAVTMGMASDRFDARRAIVLDEANAIGTTYLRAGYLPEPAASQIRELMREYVPLRIRLTASGDVQADIVKSEAILDQAWTIAEGVAKTTNQGDLTSTFIESLNEVINLHEARVTAAGARVPETVVLLLVFGSALSIGMVGYSAGLTRRRSFLSAAVLIIALGAVITIVIDLDRPREGLIQVSQQPLIDVQQQVGPPQS
jgi:hypothetical protein